MKLLFTQVDSFFVFLFFQRVGTKVAVKIEEVNVANKKLVLSMKTNRADVSAFTGVASDKWLQAIVQKVTDFGLFARPAGFDTAGMLVM